MKQPSQAGHSLLCPQHLIVITDCSWSLPASVAVCQGSVNLLWRQTDLTQLGHQLAGERGGFTRLLRVCLRLTDGVVEGAIAGRSRDEACEEGDWCGEDAQ